ncbi:hypothetical protein SAMN05444920_114159 [Nonomuraea solani]|uniref:Uncharacterized protein n=2 Tax=Nonomuraea solani TaxID=1144553 RepID=A0A1H6ER40_9ACTN|nr:hypothetical protein SAMN05444920_114159 [Nonomuraea solani]
MSAPAARPLDGERLSDLIMRLLLDGRLRERLATEGAAAVATSEGELECLETIDLDELDAAARRFRSTIWRLGTGGSLATAFPHSLRLIAATEAELLDGFLGSPRFAEFRLVPYAGTGLSVEEAFARFLLDLAPEPRVLRETITHELMIALFTALSCERPLSFAIGCEGIVETGRGHAALRRYAPDSLTSWGENPGEGAEPVPYAYFATPAGVTRGVVSERVAAAFAAEPSDGSRAARDALSRRGLW